MAKRNTYGAATMEKAKMMFASKADLDAVVKAGGGKPARLTAMAILKHPGNWPDLSRVLLLKGRPSGDVLVFKEAAKEFNERLKIYCAGDNLKELTEGEYRKGALEHCRRVLVECNIALKRDPNDVAAKANKADVIMIFKKYGWAKTKGVIKGKVKDGVKASQAAEANAGANAEVVTGASREAQPIAPALADAEKNPGGALAEAAASPTLDKLAKQATEGAAAPAPVQVTEPVKGVDEEIVVAKPEAMPEPASKQSPDTGKVETQAAPALPAKNETTVQAKEQKPSTANNFPYSASGNGRPFTAEFRKIGGKWDGQKWNFETKEKADHAQKLMDEGRQTTGH